MSFDSRWYTMVFFVVLGRCRLSENRATNVAAANSFEVVAKGWMEERKTVVEIGQYEKTLARFKNDVFPWLFGD